MTKYWNPFMLSMGGLIIVSAHTQPELALYAMFTLMVVEIIALVLFIPDE